MQHVASLRELVDANLHRLLHFFMRMDTSGEGKIDRAIFRKSVYCLGLNASDDLCDAVFDTYDIKGTGYLEYQGIQTPEYPPEPYEYAPSSTWPEPPVAVFGCV